MFKPMLSATVEDVTALTFPLYATPKIDGIRCLLLDGGDFQPNRPVTRSLKDIPNRFIREVLARTLPVGLDGELWVRGASTFGEVSSAVMSRDGEPNFSFYIFDWYNQPGSYLDRTEKLKTFARRWPRWCAVLAPIQIRSAAQLTKYEEAQLRGGHEGVMLRRGDSPYKHGRSTLREGYLMKLKRFTDAEALVIGFKERMHNGNELETDHLGHAKRSSHKANMIPMGTLGALVCQAVDGGTFETGTEFEIGTGFDDAQRALIWDQRGSYIGRLVKFKHQPFGAKDAPRIPVFLGFRSKEDM